MSSVGQRFLEAAAAGLGRLSFHLPDGTIDLAPQDFAERALMAAEALVLAGIEPGDHVGLLGRNRPEWATWAFATWLAGAAVVPLQVPVRIFDADAFADRTRSVIKAANCKMALAAPELKGYVPEELSVEWELPQRHVPVSLPTVRGDARAVIQYTSGSTSEPRGAVVTHEAVLAQMSSLVQGTSQQPAEDTTLGWVPFFHDLGLFFFLLLPALHMDAAHFLPTEQFARDPAQWLQLAPKVGATILDAPQAGWAAALGALARRGLDADLTSVELAWFGAEALDPRFLEDFVAVAPRLHLSTKTIGNTYGLAEAVLAVTVTPRGTGASVNEFDREALARRGEAKAPTSTATRMVSSGRPLTGMQVRVVDDNDCPLADQLVGHLQIGGPSRMTGYLNRDPAEAAIGDWVRTGDLGFIDGGELFVTGRAKDMIVVAGHNFFPEDFEWAASRVEGVRPGRCVAFTVENGARIVLLVEPSGSLTARSLQRSVAHSVADAVGATADVRVVPAGAIEKTTSGKLRRQLMKQRFENGDVTSL